MQLAKYTTTLKLMRLVEDAMQYAMAMGTVIALPSLVFVLAAVLLLRNIESESDLALASIVLMGFGAVIVWKVRNGYSNKGIFKG